MKKLLKKKKKITAVSIIVMIALFAVAGCENSENPPEDEYIYPVMTVLTGSTVIAQDDTIGFDVVLNGESGSSITFTIDNSGDALLYLTGNPMIAITGTGASQFDVVKQPVSPVSIGGTTEFIIAFTPDSPGIKNAVVTIASNVSYETSFGFVITGTCIGNARLLDVAVSDGELDPGFNPEIASYTLTLPDAVETIAVTAWKAHPESAMELRPDDSPWQEIASGIASEPLNLVTGIIVIEIKVTANDSTENIYTITVTRLSADSCLDSLTISSGTLDPAFKQEILQYNTTIDSGVESVTVTATASHPAAGLEVKVNNGKWAALLSGSPSDALTMNEGQNTVQIRVTAEDASTTMYTLSIYRLSSNAGLATLKLSSGSLTPAFHASVFSYTTDIPNKETVVSITPTADHTGATIRVRANDGTWEDVASGTASGFFSMDVGENTVEIEVTAEDTSVQLYTVIIIRLPSDNAYLSGFALSAGTLKPTFSKFQKSYSASLFESSLTVTPEKEHAGAIIEIRINGGTWQSVLSGNPYGSLALDIGSNTIEVRVTAEDGITTRIYTISVYRNNENTLDLSGLAVSRGTLLPVFDSGIFDYTCGVSNAAGSVTVTPTSADTGSGIEARINSGGWQTVLSGNPSPALSLNTGSNRIEIKVTAAYGDVYRIYTIMVVRGAPGIIDIGFNTGSGFNAYVYKIHVQPDGKILAGGSFNRFNGVTRYGLVRLHTDGTLDTGFNPYFGGSCIIDAMTMDADNNVLVAVRYYPDRISIKRLRPDGSIDSTFLEVDLNDIANSIAVQPDGKILISGQFTVINPDYPGISVSCNYIARLNENGLVDKDFLIGTGANNRVNAMVLQSDGKVVLGGDFTSFNTTACRYIVRLNSDGTVDTTLHTGESPDGSITHVLADSDGKLLIAGNFKYIQGYYRNHIARLHATGTIDTGFNPQSGAESSITAMAFQPDGKIIIGGMFTWYESPSFPGKYLARVNHNGSLDTGFDPQTSTGGGSLPSIYTVAVLPDGKILAGGTFSSYNSISCGCIVRIWGE
ncbi:MAG: cadherin-like beta sandwich domain-containing protein [Spirochaetales bacterium]|nr:cadherin-like beta sandwich domain-containing protein [Spirochaetales bacterium]